MTSKRLSDSSTSGESAKKKRKVIGLEEKLAIISTHGSGAPKAKIGRDHSISESTVHNIIQNSLFIKKISIFILICLEGIILAT